MEVDWSEPESYSDKLERRIRVLEAQVEELEHSQLKKENTSLRKALIETNKNYVEVVNENLNLKKELEKIHFKIQLTKDIEKAEQEAASGTWGSASDLRKGENNE